MTPFSPVAVLVRVTLGDTGSPGGALKEGGALGDPAAHTVTLHPVRRGMGRHNVSHSTGDTRASAVTPGAPKTSGSGHLACGYVHVCWAGRYSCGDGIGMERC